MFLSWFLVVKDSITRVIIGPSKICNSNCNIKCSMYRVCILCKIVLFGILDFLSNLILAYLVNSSFHSGGTRLSSAKDD